MRRGRPGPARALLATAALLAGCAQTPPDPEDLEVAEGEESAVQRASQAFESGDLVGARAALEEHLDDEPEDAQAQYLLARILVGMDELRGARRSVERALAGDPKNPLYMSLLASLHEALGEHHRALDAYADVIAAVPESLDPIYGAARCQLYVGDPDGALATLQLARERPSTAPMTEYLTFQAYRRLGREDDAEGAARAFLEAAEGDAGQRLRAVEVKRWLATASDALPAPARQVMIDYVRAACRLRLPDTVGPERAVIERAPERLLVFDDRPVFVTLFAADGVRLRGHGRGRSLASALKGAVEAAQEDPAYTPLAVRQAAIRVDVGHALEPIEVRRGRHGLEAEPPVVRGRHGVALRADGREIFALPGDVLTAGLPDLRAMLEHAAAAGGLGRDAWHTATHAAFRFETDAFVSAAPGAAAVRTQDGEPLPRPEAYPEEVERAAAAAAAWLTTLLGTDGGAAAGYDPIADARAESEPPPRVEALMAAALAGRSGRRDDRPLLAAARHLADRARARLLEATGPEPAAQARLLEALHALRRLEAEPDPALAAATDELAATLAAGEPAEPRARASAARALVLHAGAAGEPRWLDAARRLLDDEPPDDAAAARALYALERADPRRAQREALLAWARRELAGATPTTGQSLARSAASLAEVARLARDLRDPSAEDLRREALARLTALLGLQLADRHAFFLRAPSRSLGGVRERRTSPYLPAETGAAALEALEVALEELLQ